LLRDQETTLTILREQTAEERYLTLPELGRVLQELGRALPGGFMPLRRKGLRGIVS